MKIADRDRFRISVRATSVRMLALAGSTLVLAACGSKSEPPPESVGSQAAAQSAALTQLTNQKGRLTTTGNSQRRTAFSYDALGRAKDTAHAMEGAEYVYTNQYGYPKRALGPGDPEPGTVLQSTRLPDGEIVSYAYDSGGAQQTITAGSDVIVAGIRRNPKGQTTSVLQGDGVETEHRYNDQGDLRLRQIVSTHRPSGHVLQAYEYDFDGAGNVKQILDYCNPDTDQCPCDPSLGASCVPNRLSRAFDYDEMDRLIQVRAPDGMSIAGLPRGYGYDAIDNLTQKDGISQTYGANGKQPHALASANGVTYSYDPNGNLVSTNAGLTIAWNGQNMPMLTIKNGQRVRKQFVGEGVWKKVEGDTTTLYLPSIRIENGRLRKYYDRFAERDPDAGGALRFYHGDHLGSSTLVTEAGGNVVFRAAYLPYGEDDPSFTRQNSFDPKYKFNFKERDETSDLYDYGARMYNPATGRWISPDTVTSDGLNRYAYVSNNPLRYVDPTGHLLQEPKDSSQEWREMSEAAATFLLAFAAGHVPVVGDFLAEMIDPSTTVYASTFEDHIANSFRTNKLVLDAGRLVLDLKSMTQGDDYITKGFHVKARTERGPAVEVNIRADYAPGAKDPHITVTAGNNAKEIGKKHIDSVVDATQRVFKNDKNIAKYFTKEHLQVIRAAAVKLLLKAREDARLAEAANDAQKAKSCENRCGQLVRMWDWVEKFFKKVK